VFTVPFQHLPAETKKDNVWTQGLPNTKDCQMLKYFSWLLKSQICRGSPMYLQQLLRLLLPSGAWYHVAQ